jgi:predicted RNA binding protein YcfA (HicA-like mRNA interferase family)
VAEYEKKVRALLNQYGCSFVRHGKGDHDIWRSPLTPLPFTVPTKIDNRHTANGILKQAGINYKF